MRQPTGVAAFLVLRVTRLWRRHGVDFEMTSLSPYRSVPLLLSKRLASPSEKFPTENHAAQVAVWSAATVLRAGVSDAQTPSGWAAQVAEVVERPAPPGRSGADRATVCLPVLATPRPPALYVGPPTTPYKLKKLFSLFLTKIEQLDSPPQREQPLSGSPSTAQGGQGLQV